MEGVLVPLGIACRSWSQPVELSTVLTVCRQALPCQLWGALRSPRLPRPGARKGLVSPLWKYGSGEVHFLKGGRLLWDRSLRMDFWNSFYHIRLFRWFRDECKSGGKTHPCFSENSGARISVTEANHYPAKWHA